MNNDTQRRKEAHISGGGVEKDVTFAEADEAINDALDAAYRDKYRRYAAQIVGSIVSPQARGDARARAARNPRISHHLLRRKACNSPRQ